MSLYGSYMGDFEDDPFFGAHIRQMRHMNNMVHSMFANSPFGMMGGGMGGGMGALMGGMAGMGPPALTAAPHHMRPQEMMPYGYPGLNMNMNRMFQGLGSMGAAPNCHSYSSSSTVMTMGTGPDGRPQVYQESSSTRVAPGGIKETKKSSCDSRSGVKKIAIGHHIGERAHVLEREQNLRSGDQEERQEFINLDEEEAEDFNREFERKVNSVGQQQGAIGYRHGSGHSRRHREPQLALPSTAATSSAPSSPQPDPASPQERTRKRDHTPEPDSEQPHRKTKSMRTAPEEEDEDSIETIVI